MKGEILEKSPPLLLPPQKHLFNAFSRQTSSKNKEDRIMPKLNAKYDAFQGILKRVSEMKLNGSLDSEEPSTCSEKSESSTSEQLRQGGQSGSSSFDNPSNLSIFEDESCGSSITGSDCYPPYEEISKVNCSNRYSCCSLPYSVCAETSVSSFRGNFFPPSSPTKQLKNASRQNSPKEYKIKEHSKKQSFQGSLRPNISVSTGNQGGRALLLTADVNDNCAKFYGRAPPSLEPNGQPEGISEGEKHQLEMFFKSLKTDVFVCGSLANLYFGWKEGEKNWSFRHTGAVVIVFDSGDTRCRGKRKIQILLAERGTCFPLWKDTIDNLSAYHKSGTAFHTMYLSSDHRQMVGLSFDSPLEADRLLAYLEELTANPENINISIPGSKKKKKISPKKKTTSLPHKKNISNPCFFQHVTSVVVKDKPIYMSLQTLIGNENIKKVENMC